MLTPLERELLASVEELTRTCEQSVNILQNSEEALKYSQQRVNELSMILANDLLPSVLALAKLQNELLQFWSTSSPGQPQTHRLQSSLQQQSDELNFKIRVLENSMNRIAR